MRIALNSTTVRLVQFGSGWTSGVRLVEEIAGGPHKGDSILEGEPAQFEALYDQLNGLSIKAIKGAMRVREAIERKEP